MMASAAGMHALVEDHNLRRCSPQGGACPLPEAARAGVSCDRFSFTEQLLSKRREFRVGCTGRHATVRGHLLNSSQAGITVKPRISILSIAPLSRSVLAATVSNGAEIDWPF